MYASPSIMVVATTPFTLHISSFTFALNTPLLWPFGLSHYLGGLTTISYILSIMITLKFLEKKHLPWKPFLSTLSKLVNKETR